MDSLFQGLDFTRLDDASGNTSALASEVWLMFLVIMIVALIAEALLSLPERRSLPASADPGAENAVTGFSSARRSTTESVSSSL